MATTVQNESIVINVHNDGKECDVLTLDRSGYGQEMINVPVQDAVEYAQRMMDADTPLCEPGGLRGTVTVVFGEDVVFPDGVVIEESDEWEY